MVGIDYSYKCYVYITIWKIKGKNLRIWSECDIRVGIPANLEPGNCVPQLCTNDS